MNNQISTEQILNLLSETRFGITIGSVGYHCPTDSPTTICLAKYLAEGLSQDVMQITVERIKKALNGLIVVDNKKKEYELNESASIEIASYIVQALNEPQEPCEICERCRDGIIFESDRSPISVYKPRICPNCGRLLR